MAQQGIKQIEVLATTDTICPWCYVGYAKLQRAIKQLEDENIPAKITVRFAPFQLDPTLPSEPVNKKERFIQRFGAERIKGMEETMKGRFEEMGLPTYNTAGVVRQTTNSHRLLWKAEQKGGPQLQHEVIMGLYPGYFTDSKDIGDIDGFLSDVAVEKGVFPTKSEAVEWLKSPEGLPEYNAAIEKARRQGISGVPFWIIDGKYAVSGAQDPETFYKIFKGITEGNFNPRSGY